MRTAARVIAVLAITTIAAPFVAAADPPNDRPTRTLQFELVDGTVITGRSDVKTISIRIPSGNILKIPVAKMEELTRELKKQPSPTEQAQFQSKIKADDSVFLGTLSVKEFKIASPYGRATVKLDDIRRIRPGDWSTSVKPQQWNVELDDKTHITGRLATQTIRIKTRYGAMLVPLTHIRKAIIAENGKQINVTCWGSGRIIGTPLPGAKLSLHTDKGPVNISMKHAVAMSPRPRWLHGHRHGINSIAFSSNGKHIASGSDDRSIKVWDAASRRELFTLKGHSGEVWSVAFSKDGKRLISGSTDKRVEIWDLAYKMKALTFKGHKGWVYAVAFSPDGKLAASASGDNTVKIWDSTSGKVFFTFKDAHWISSLAFSPDGKHLATAGESRREQESKTMGSRNGRGDFHVQGAYLRSAVGNLLA